MVWYNIPRYMTFLPRFVFMWLAVLVCGAKAFVVQKLAKDPYNIPEESWLGVKKVIIWVANFELHSSGYSGVDRRELQICYKKYLGPDWKRTFTGAPTLISNHRSWIDITIGVGTFCACFVAALRVRSIPGVWRVTDML